MGHSISEATWNRMRANRLEGRQCVGGLNYCSARATRLVTSQVWLLSIGEGGAHDSQIKLCTKHAKPYHPGYRGRNFITQKVEKF